MDINTIWDSIVIIKIRRDDSNKFTLKEIETFAKVYNMDVEAFCTDILKLSKRQIYKLKNGNNVKCMEYEKLKQEFFKEKASEYRQQIIKEKIKTDSSSNFDIEELKSLSQKTGINIYDFSTNVLGISRDVLNRFKNGEFKTVSSKKYKDDKIDYFNRINDSILEYVLSSKIKNDFSNRFSYDEIMKYVNKFEINIRDFLSNILGMETYNHGRRENEGYI